ncbi:MAG TPA: tetratricopeptide repeat protein [Pseudomonadota bacterium]|nr:tetratricopeptide repeat protein [Pseudomonadota bacterium]
MLTMQLTAPRSLQLTDGKGPRWRRTLGLVLAGLCGLSSVALAEKPGATKPKSATAAAPTITPYQFSGPLAPVQLAVRGGRYAEAIAKAQKLLPTLKDPVLRDEVQALHAQALRRTGQVDKAITLLEAAVLQDAAALSCRAQLGLAYRERSDRAHERAMWDGFFDDHDADRLKLDDPRAVRLLGVATRYRSAIRDSYEQLRTAIDLAAAQNNVWEYIQANLALTELRIEKHEIGYAETSAEAALLRDPGNPEANALMARVKLEQGNDVAGATLHIDRALATCPGFSPALALRAEILIDNEEYEKAIALTDEMLKINTVDLLARSLRSAALFLLDRKAESVAEKTKVLAHSPLYTDFHRLVAERYVIQHRYDDVVKILEEAVQINPKDFNALSDLGSGYLRLGEDEKGYKALDAAWASDHFNKRTYNLLNLFDDVLRKKYTLLTLDIDPAKKGAGGLRLRVSKDEEKLLVPLVLPMVQAEWQELAKRYEFSPKLPLTLELYKEPQYYGVRTVGLPNLAALGVTFGQVVTGRSPAGGNFNWALMIWHELSHVFALQQSKGRVPRWFTEGLSEWETLHLHSDWQRRTHAEVATALRDGTLLSLADLNLGFTRAKSLSHMVVAYHEAALAIEFLIRRYGFPKIVQCLKRFGEGQRTPQVLPEVYGKPIAALDEEFRTDLKAQLRPYAGTFYVRPNDYADEEALKKGVKDKPTGCRENGLLALAMVRAGDSDPRDPEIEQALTAAKKGDPACKEALLAEGERALRLEKYPDAEARFRELIAKGGDGYDVRQRLGDLYLKQEELPRAIVELQKAKQLDPDRPEPYERLARIFTKQQHEDQALAELQMAAKLDVMDADTTVALVARLYDARKWPQVLEFGEMARHLRPYSPELRAQIAEAHLALGQPQRAVPELEAALLALPDPQKLGSELDPEEAAEVTAKSQSYRALLEKAKRQKPGVPLLPPPRPKKEAGKAEQAPPAKPKAAAAKSDPSDE